jgi:hypothetical protein
MGDPGYGSIGIMDIGCVRVSGRERVCVSERTRERSGEGGVWMWEFVWVGACGTESSSNRRWIYIRV